MGWGEGVGSNDIISFINHHNKHVPYHKQVTVACFGHSSDNLLGI